MKKNVVIATHAYVYGQSQALNEYFQGKAEVLFIEHALFGNLLTWTLGAIDTFYQVLKAGKKFDLYVGSNNLNALVGILLKKIGRVKKVIFHTPDSPPNRFANKGLNNLYRWIDVFCVRRADLVWNNNDSMVAEREKRGLSLRYRSKQIEVPMGAEPIKQRPFNEIEPYLIGFSGHLAQDKGLDLLLEAMSEVTKQIPQARLLIIGSGPIETRLKSQVEKLQLKNVEFTGCIENIKEVYQRLSRCAIAVAPYSKTSDIQWADPAKVKVYFSVGLPVIVTKAHKIAYEVERENCGVAINYDRQELIDAIVRLLKDANLLRTYRNNVTKLAHKYSYDNIFAQALDVLEW